MRVLHVTYEYPGVTSNCGGGGRVTQLLDTHLQDRGHDSRVVTDDGDGHWATFPARSVPRVRRAIADHEPDIVHGHFALPSSLLLPELVRDATPLVVTCMGADVYDPTRFAAIRAAADRVTSRVLESADAVVTPSTDMTHRVASKWPVDPVRINHGIDADEWSWEPRDLGTSPTVLSVCRLVERKQLDRAVEAVARWRRDTGRDVTYRIVGTGPAAADLAPYQQEYGWLHLDGYVDHLQPVMDDADLFVLPSDHEAFGLAIAEALAAGLPVVTTPHGGQTDLVDDRVGAVAPAAPHALASALEEAAADYRARQRATRGYVAANFSAERMAKQYENLYSNLTASRRLAASQSPTEQLQRLPSSF